MEPKDISVEEWREYVFAGSGDKRFVLKIENPKDLYISESGSHRVVDKTGITHWVSKDFISIRWYAPTEPVSF